MDTFFDDPDFSTCSALECLYLRKWIEQHPFGDTTVGESLCECVGTLNTCPEQAWLESEKGEENE